MRWMVLAFLVAVPPGAAAGFRVRLDAGVVSLDVEEYVAGVIAGESSVFRSDEALKAMAVAARSYAVRLRGRHASEGFDFCITTHCQHLERRAVTPRLVSIAGQTAGELLWFEGKPAFACYTRNCGGRTEAVAAVWPDLAEPYLQSHPDSYCLRSGNVDWQWTSTSQDLVGALRRSGLRSPPVIEHIAVAETTASGRARVLTLLGGGESVRISAGSLRFAAGRALGWNTLRSDRYQVGAGLVFQGSGAGHGVGLCQNGADQMGSDGRSYREILNFYYPGTVVGVTARGFAWRRISGETISVLSTQPDQDRAVLGLAERLLRGVTQRTNLPPPENVEIRVYPDMDAFRNATTEPGWVAAHTTGHRIHLQPPAVLRGRGALEQVLRHELLHVMVETRARPGLPVWFREGLVGFLDTPGHTGRSGAAGSGDGGIQQTQDAARARDAYREATRRVAALVERYGEDTVWSWLRLGLPPDVR